MTDALDSSPAVTARPMQDAIAAAQWFDANRSVLGTLVSHISEILAAYTSNQNAEPRVENFDAQQLALEDSMLEILRAPNDMGVVAMNMPSYADPNVTWRETTEQQMSEAMDVPYAISGMPTSIPAFVSTYKSDAPVTCELMLEDVVRAESVKLKTYTDLRHALLTANQNDFTAKLNELLKDKSLATGILAMGVDISKSGEAPHFLPWCTAVAWMMKQDATMLPILNKLLVNGASINYSDILLKSADWSNDLIQRFFKSVPLRTGFGKVTSDLTSFEDGENTPLLRLMKNDALLAQVLQALPDDYERAQLFLKGARTLRTEDADKLHTVAIAMLGTFIPAIKGGQLALEHMSALYLSEDKTPKAIVDGKAYALDVPLEKFNRLRQTLALARDWVGPKDGAPLFRMADIAVISSREDDTKVFVKNTNLGVHLTHEQGEALCHDLRKNNEFKKLDRFFVVNSKIISASKSRANFLNGQEWLGFREYDSSPNFGETLKWMNAASYYNPNLFVAATNVFTEGVFFNNFYGEFTTAAGKQENAKLSADLREALTNLASQPAHFRVGDAKSGGETLARLDEIALVINKGSLPIKVYVDGVEDALDVSHDKDAQQKVQKATSFFAKANETQTFSASNLSAIFFDAANGKAKLFYPHSAYAMDVPVDGRGTIPQFLKNDARLVLAANNTYFKFDRVRSIAIEDGKTVVDTTATEPFGFDITDAARKRMVTAIDQRNRAVILAGVENMPTCITKLVLGEEAQDLNTKSAANVGEFKMAARRAKMCLAL